MYKYNICIYFHKLKLITLTVALKEKSRINIQTSKFDNVC